MKFNLIKLLFIASLSVTMTACSTNPVNNNGSVTGTNTGNTYTSGSYTNTTNTETTDTGGYTYDANANNGSTNSVDNNTDNTDTNSYNYDTNDSDTATTDNTSNTENNTENTNNASQKGFVVQLTASISPQKANRIKNTFAAEGYPMIQNNITVNGRVLYRVQIGPYTTQGEAKAVLNKMRKRYRRNAFVKSAIINENK